MYDPEDNVLEPHPFAPFDSIYQVYPYFENDSALGQVKYQTSPNITLPENYVPIDVRDEIKDIHDADSIEGWDFGLCNLMFPIF